MKSSPLFSLLSLTCLILSHSSFAHAQQFGADQTFEEVKKTRITPQDFNGNLILEDPKTTFLHSLGTPTRMRPEALLKLHKTSQLALMEVVTITTPKPPFAPTPQLNKGHAIWIKPPATKAHPDPDPVLISPLLWLQKAQEIWVRPTPARTPGRRAPKVKTMNLRAMTAQGKIRAFRDEQHQYKRVQRAQPDKWRDLVVLKGRGVRSRGALALFDSTKEPLVKLFGFSPHLTPNLQEATLEMRKDPNPALAYYFLSNYPATLGAPLVDPKGRLVMMTSLRHYKDAQISLVIPPKSLRQFVTRLLDPKAP